MREQLSEACEVLTELMVEGVLITDPLPASACPAGSGNEIGYRTFVQLDGDICTSIHAKALACPEFAATYSSHLQHVQTLLGKRISWLLRSIRKIRWFVAGAGLGITLYAPSSWIELTDVSSHIAWSLAVAPLVAWFLSKLTRWFVHRWLRRLVQQKLAATINSQSL
ncbi:MAG TPA: hypothetical protein ENK31_08490 [Nannocystis exedens]|nr:hypothetical protein [Nannocystis exedens]